MIFGRIAPVRRVRKESYDIEDELQAAAQADRVLAFVEAHLFEPLSVARIAREYGLSAFHFSRQFHQRHGESVMSYVRGRRLETAAARLASEPTTTLATIAMDCGFESQAGFTRAFKRAFGKAPGKFRRADEPRIRKRRKSMDVRPVIHESVEVLDTCRVAGLSGRFDPSTYTRIALLWKEFVTKMNFEGRLGDGETCGVFRERNFSAGSFEHLAGARIAPGAPAPPGLEIWTIPARTYLVFKQMLDEKELHVQTMAAQTEIWGERGPRSGHKLADTPDFQIYPANFKLGNGGWLAYYVPVE
jgi:AraC family transcriptional regulator